MRDEANAYLRRQTALCNNPENFFNNDCQDTREIAQGRRCLTVPSARAPVYQAASAIGRQSSALQPPGQAVFSKRIIDGAAVTKYVSSEVDMVKLIGESVERFTCVQHLSNAMF